MKSTASNQQGVVAIVVTMMTMLVVTLVVMTYSQNIVRDQRQTLDRQLNTQAFYSDESAANAISYGIENKVFTADDIKGNNTCSGAGSSANKIAAYPKAAPYVDTSPSTSNFAITCLQVDTSNTEASVNSLAANTSRIAHIDTTGANDIGEIEVAWQDPATTNPTFPAATTNFPALSSWDSTYPAILRIDLVPWSANSTADSLSAAEQVYYLYPTDSATAGSGLSSLLGDKKGEIVLGKCNASVPNTPKFCRATIVGLASKDYYMRIRPLYRNADLVITPRTGAGTAIEMTSGQVIVDVTARSNDILKRISVRRSIVPSYTTPDFVIDSASSICKRQSVTPSGAGSTDVECGGIN
jgi:Tfp pilus assembly protein PilX